MDQIKFKTNSTNSFFGHFLYDQVLPKDHFLVVAKREINWQRFTDICIKWYKRSDRGGRPPYNPSVLCRMLFLSYLYNISERQIEHTVNDSLSMKYFLDLGVDETPPDSTTLTKFKQRLLKGGRERAFDELLAGMLNEAKTKGVNFGQVQIVDATHTIADVNTQKDKERQKDKDDNDEPKDPKPPRDPDASWGAKRKYEVKDPKTGKTVKQTEYFYGYKAHESFNPQSGLITSVITTTGKTPDGELLPKLEIKDRQAKLLPKKQTYAADKGYDWGENHLYLEEHKHHDAIILTDNRLNKKDKNKKKWEKLVATKQYREGKKARKVIEKIFGNQKQCHGLKRCRYVGLQRYHVQAVLSAAVFNLGVVVAQISGTTLRGYARSNSFST